MQSGEILLGFFGVCIGLFVAAYIFAGIWED